MRAIRPLLVDGPKGLGLLILESDYPADSITDVADERRVPIMAQFPSHNCIMPGLDSIGHSLGPVGPPLYDALFSILAGPFTNVALPIRRVRVHPPNIPPPERLGD